MSQQEIEGLDEIKAHFITSKQAPLFLVFQTDQPYVGRKRASAQDGIEAFQREIEKVTGVLVPMLLVSSDITVTIGEREDFEKP